MKYKIVTVEDRESKAGRKYKTISIEDEEGFVTSDIGVFDKLETLKVGATIEGDIRKSPDGKFTNFNFPRTAKGGSNSSMIAKAQETKRKDIEHFQETKMDSIRMSGAMRDATIILNMLVQAGQFEPLEWEDGKNKTWQEKWLEIRDFFLNSWDKDVEIPFN